MKKTIAISVEAGDERASCNVLREIVSDLQFTLQQLIMVMEDENGPFELSIEFEGEEQLRIDNFAHCSE